MSARFDDLAAGTALVFAAPDRTVAAYRPDEVPGVLEAVDAATRAGAWAFGMLAYEAAPGIDPALPTRSADGGAPLAWFGFGPAPRTEVAITRPVAARHYWCSAWTVDLAAADHTRAVERIRSSIAAGELYQANLTTRLHARAAGDLTEMYADLVHAQTGAYNAYLDLGGWTVLSASPELFVEWAGERLRCRPMKGTAARGADPAGDAAARSALEHSAKDIAENVMIVDLVRNDLGRIARTGSVRVRDLCTAEPYGTVWQLTSGIDAVAGPDLTPAQLVAALFPSGSVTGAPKTAAMRLIAELEPAPRGVYCGAIGWFAPPWAPVRARFNVAIRTLTVEAVSGRAVYGAGGGITIGSEPGAEYAELVAKTRVLDAVVDDRPLELLETFGYDPAAGCVHLDRHLERLAASARCFGFDYDEARIRAVLAPALAGAGPARVGLRLQVDGTPVLRLGPRPEPPVGAVRLALDDVPVRPDSLWLRHKTNRRKVYDEAATRHPDADDVVLVNERGELTESTVANLAVRLDGNWWTPPTACGCLPGVGRALALASGRVRERVLTAADLHRGELALINSLRGWRPARLSAAASRTSG